MGNRETWRAGEELAARYLTGLGWRVLERNWRCPSGELDIVAVACVRIEPQECDRLGMHVADIQGLRRALLRLDTTPGFVLTDGFGVDGLGVPGLAVWKGDRVAACVAAASVVAKVTRDAIMADYARDYEGFAFDVHKGYCTATHRRELREHGPTDIHRWCFGLVRDSARVGSP